MRGLSIFIKSDGGGRGVLLDELPDTLQKGENPFLGRLDEHLAPVFAYRHAQEVKARIHLPDNRLVR